VYFLIVLISEYYMAILSMSYSDTLQIPVLNLNPEFKLATI